MEDAERIEPPQTLDPGVPSPPSVPQGAHAGNDRPPDQLSVDGKITELKFHAKGGLGVVYVAKDQRLQRQVAVKFIHEHLLDNDECRQRFELEAEVTGRLEHPGVVPLYGVGRDEHQRLFYYMRYIDGTTLEESIRKLYGIEQSLERSDWQGLEFRRLLTSFVSVCKTVAYAHNRGIVHRDLKPDNVMLGRFGETIVVDWGLAVPVVRDERFRISGEHTLLPASGSGSGSSSGQGVGTPAYMSPEQTSGLAPTPASDVYSLGATLYKIITGRTPFQSKNIHDLRSRVIEGKFSRPSQVQPQVPRALEAICLKAMALSPADRYDTALDLAQDVENFLGDSPVVAYQEPMSQRMFRWARRHRMAAQASLLGLVGILLVSGIASVWLGNMAHSQHLAREETERARLSAESARRDNLQSSARFLARSLAYEIDLRWRILEAEANSAQLRERMLAANGDPQNVELRQPVQSWLEKRFIAHRDATKCLSWFITARDGTQVARVPEAASIGNNYAHRDYFHGLGRDLQPGSPEAEQAKPFADRDVHMSAAYESTNTHTLMVAFSVPIYDAPPETVDRQRIGVLCMAVELGHFPIGRQAILIDTRDDQLEGKPGLVLHHAEMGLRSREELPPRMDSQTLKFAQRLRSVRMGNGGESSAETSSLRVGFIDPVTRQVCLAAIEPVIIQARDTAIADTGWVVVVKE